jgi:hypothetical protein
MARSGTYGTKQKKVEDCRQWPMHHQGATGVSRSNTVKSKQVFDCSLCAKK